MLAEAFRWIARIAGTLMVLFILALIVGEGLPPLLRMPLREQLYWCGLCSLFAGLIVACFREGWGGLLSLLAWGFLSLMAGKPARDLPFSIPAAIGAVHLVCWLRLRDRPGTPGAALALAKSMGPPLAIFLLLAANEIFGQPPLMTPSGAPPAALTGTWVQAAETVLTIAADGSVTGSLEAQPVSGRLTGNRSWFGRVMHWRTDYRIAGATPRDGRFQAPLILREGVLEGSVTFGDARPPKWVRLRLRRH